MKSPALTILASLSLASVLYAQDGRRFEITSIKETRSFETRAAFQPGPTGINIQHATAQEIVAWAHDMLDHDVAGGPDWVRSTRFHVTGKSGGAPLRPSLDRPVIDRTELSGQFDFIVSATPGGVTRDAAGKLVPVVPHSAFDVHPSLQDRLGLKLESTRAEVPTVVIRRIQPPKEN